VAGGAVGARPAPDPAGDERQPAAVVVGIAERPDALAGADVGRPRGRDWLPAEGGGGQRPAVEVGVALEQREVVIRIELAAIGVAGADQLGAARAAGEPRDHEQVVERAVGPGDDRVEVHLDDLAVGVDHGADPQQQVLDRANRVVKQVAEAEKYDVVLQEAVYINPKLDITDKVIKALNSSK